MIHSTHNKLKDAFVQYEQRFRELLKTTRPPDGHYLPHRIVIFRDGVSEGEFSTVFTQELGALQSITIYFVFCHTDLQLMSK